jgi:hypothetical protein
LVLLACEGVANQAVLFRADGSGQQAVTGPWDRLQGRAYQWAPDGAALFFERVNSCCAPPSSVPEVMPMPGWVQYNIGSGETHLVSTFRVAGVAPDDSLNVRTGPGVGNPVLGTIPPDATDIRITGDVASVSNSRWAPVAYDELVGWVNLRYLERQAPP